MHCIVFEVASHAHVSSCHFLVPQAVVSVRRGRPEISAPPLGRSVVEILLMFQRCIYCLMSQKSKKYLIKNVRKSIFEGEFDQKIPKFCWDFSKLSPFCCPNRENFAGLFTFPCPMEFIIQILVLVHFSTNFSLFSTQISWICIKHFQLSLSI